MSGGDGNKTVFKPSPLQGLKDGGQPAPPPKTKPGRPVKPVTPAASAPSESTETTIRPAFKPDMTQATEQASNPQPATPSVAAPRQTPKKAVRKGSSVWLSLAVAAALAAIILYFIFRYSGLA